MRPSVRVSIVALALSGVLSVPAESLAWGRPGGGVGGGPAPGVGSAGPFRGHGLGARPGGMPLSRGPSHRPHVVIPDPRSFHQPSVPLGLQRRFAHPGFPRHFGHPGFGHPGFHRPFGTSFFVGVPSSVVTVVAPPSPVPYVAAPEPAVVYAPPAAVAPMDRIVQYPHGRYELHGDGLSTPYVWVWIPNAPAPPPVPAPPPPPASAPSSSVPPSAVPPAPVARTTIYQWTDDQGVTHFTNDRDSVPDRYRGVIKERGAPARPDS